MSHSETFGNKIKELRESKGITQIQLADRMKVSRSTIANWEVGNRLPDLSMLARLAKALETEPYVLIDELSQPQEQANCIVAEDSPVMLNGFVRMLQEELPGARVRGFADAKSAMEFARTNPVAIAFLDIELGGQDGLSLANALTEINPRVNIIFLTGHAEYKGSALDMHCSGYIMKPLTPQKIHCEIDHLRYPVRGLSL